MTCDVLRIGDTNTILRVELLHDGAAVDVSSATVLQVILEKPSSALITKDAAFYTDGTDGLFFAATDATDIDEEGTWSIQAYVEMPTWIGHSGIAKFKVKSNLN